jgi:hypothetical protein
MTKIVLGGRKKYESVISYLNKNNEDYLIFDMEETKSLVSEQIPNVIYFKKEDFFSAGPYLRYFEEYQIKPTHLINFRDQKNWIELENNLNRWIFNKSLDNISKDFIIYKSIQHKICSNLNIPVLPTTGSKIIVKKDAGNSGGTDFYITDNKFIREPNTFTQKYIDIDYTIAVHAFVDNNNYWHPYCYHKVNYKDNCPVDSVSPYLEHTQEIDSYMRILKTKIKLPNKFVFWQFVKPKEENCLYNMDFNCRPAGGFEAGSYDRDIAGHNVLDYFFNKKISPNQITFKSQVECIYTIAQQFGYSDLKRTVTKINHKTIKVNKI